MEEGCESLRGLEGAEVFPSSSGMVYTTSKGAWGVEKSGVLVAADGEERYFCDASDGQR